MSARNFKSMAGAQGPFQGPFLSSSVPPSLVRPQTYGSMELDTLAAIASLMPGCTPDDMQTVMPGCSPVAVSVLARIFLPWRTWDPCDPPGSPLLVFPLAGMPVVASALAMPAHFTLRRQRKAVEVTLGAFLGWFEVGCFEGGRPNDTVYCMAAWIRHVTLHGGVPVGPTSAFRPFTQTSPNGCPSTPPSRPACPPPWQARP